MSVSRVRVDLLAGAMRVTVTVTHHHDVMECGKCTDAAKSEDMRSNLDVDQLTRTCSGG